MLRREYVAIVDHAHRITLSLTGFVNPCMLGSKRKFHIPKLNLKILTKLVIPEIY